MRLIKSLMVDLILIINNQSTKMQVIIIKEIVY